MSPRKYFLYLGQSKTLSFQIVLQNLQGAQLSSKDFCKRLPAIDPFFCLGSKYTRSEDIAYILERAIKREQHYEQNRMNTRCVVFLDEASLPDEQKMVLKVLHPYLDECKVSFVAIANKSFDAANANRIICVYRSLPSEADQHILAYGCLGLQMASQQQRVNDRLGTIINCLCQGYRRLLNSPNIPKIYHDRDFIYMLRELRFELIRTDDDQDTRVDGITSLSLLRALEENFNGISKDRFEELVDIFFKAVQEQCPDFHLPTQRRNVPTILYESMKLDSVRRRLYGRYKLIIDETEDESAVRLLAQSGVLDLDPNKTEIFRMSDFPDDINNEFRNVEILSTIKLCMETGKTILMINTERIHGSLYDVFNQNFSIMATGDSRKIWSKVAIGPKTIDVIVHEDFQCIAHVNRREFNDIPAPFLSRFQKYSLSINDFYQIQWAKLPADERTLMKMVEEKAKTFIDHFGQQYFYGLSTNTLYSCLLALIEKNNDQEQCYYLNIHQQYTQLTIKSKEMIEQNPSNTFQCLLRSILSKLMQLIPPESIILKLPTFEDQISRYICTNYFRYQDHFSLENFLRTLTSTTTSMNILTLENLADKTNQTLRSTTKVMIFTRTSSYVSGLNQQTKCELFASSNDDDLNSFNEKLDILNLSIIENSAELEERVKQYEKNDRKTILIVVINGGTSQQRLHIPYVRQLIDKVDYRCNGNKTRENLKYFLLLIHSPAQTIYHQSSFPSIFLHHWDFHFFDTCSSNHAFHLKNFLQILTSSYHQTIRETNEQILWDFDVLFQDCLWHFCSRIQIGFQPLAKEMFENRSTFEFYQRQTSTFRRVQCLKEVLKQCTQLQKRIVQNYQNYVSLKKEASKKIYTLIYQISKDILCGKRFDGLVDSIQSQTRLSFNNFVCNILKFICHDYGLETLPKLSNTDHGYDSMLNLIDYSSLLIDSNQDLISSNTSAVFCLISHYDCIPRMPLFHLFHRRIKSYADEVKIKRIQKTTDDKLRDANMHHNEYTLEEFRFALMKSIEKDPILKNIVNESVLKVYSNDLVQTFCAIVEKNFTKDFGEYQTTIEFVSRWLLMVDENERRSLDEYPYRSIWLLAHVYTSFDYDRNNLFSLYSACRIVDRLDPSRSFYDQSFQDNDSTRTNEREHLFRRMFDELWKNLWAICFENQTKETWILTYTLISKYYPSEKVLEHSQLIEIKRRIEFMALAHLIILDENLTEPQELVASLLNKFEFIHQDTRRFQAIRQKSPYIEHYSSIIQTIHDYIKEKNLPKSTLMIDVQQWIVSILKATSESYREEILALFQYLNLSNCSLAWPIKEFLFDELANIYLEYLRRNQQIKDTWDRLLLLPTLIACASNGNSLENYRLPTHPSVMSDDTTRSALIDLYFSYLKRSMNNETIHCRLINKIIQSKPPSGEDGLLRKPIEFVFGQIKDYFLIELAGLLLCQTDRSTDDQEEISALLSYLIHHYLSIDDNATKLSESLELFLSTIISKRSWNYLLNLLQSEEIQQQNHQWSTTLCRFLQLDQTTRQNSSLQWSHRIQFTLSTNQTESLFSHLQQPYQELKTILDQCVQQNTERPTWTLFTDWVRSNRRGDKLQFREMKTIVLLNIYYDYYCQNRLEFVKSLLTIIELDLDVLPEERLVFRALFQPEQSMIGYPGRDPTEERNTLNSLFTTYCRDEDELRIRHCLVNIMAMILLGGQQSFLWTFAFQPLTLETTYGFGSTANYPIERDGIHYDCGCIIAVNGDLVQFGDQIRPIILNVPAVYVAYFFTFGAMAWHLLLYENSVKNLHGPILAPRAIADKSNGNRMEGNQKRTKVCHFVFARLLSTYHFLSNRFNQDDACILINRCSEQMAYRTPSEQYHQQEDQIWIKHVYQTIDDQLRAEKEYQEHVFYFVLQQLPKYKDQINLLNLQSQMQVNLQNYIDRMPILVEYQHFQTELHNPIHSSLSLNILSHVLNSTGFLAITRSIYDLSQFYLLLHQTYCLLIERDEFIEITLADMYKRAEKHSNIVDQRLRANHWAIIQNGIKAVNAYHAFTNGLIRPGACDETQYFEFISIDTPIHYLVTNESHDQGDIVMRILSVLVDYHNKILDLVENEFNQNSNGHVSVLKTLVNDLISKEVSILQIARDNTGVITLSPNDVSCLEKLSRASLIDDKDQEKNSLKFNFRYVQSYIIRTYLLLCRINCRHIIQKYQCDERKNNQLYDEFEMIELSENYSRMLDGQKFEIEWNHLKEMLFDKLTNGYKLLRQIILLIKSNEKDLSQLMLGEFLQIHANDKSIQEQREVYEIRDFQLCYINQVQELYRNAINDFQHLFAGVPHLLRNPIDDQLNDRLKEMFKMNLIDVDYGDDIEKLKSTIHTISKLLNDLRAIENTLFERSIHSLRETCVCISIENPILSYIPEEIRCENYVSFSIHLIRMRSILQEKLVDMEEKQPTSWSEEFDKNRIQSEFRNRFHDYLNATDQNTAEDSSDNLLQDDQFDLFEMTINQIDVDQNDRISADNIANEYTSLFEMHLKHRPLTSSSWFDQLQQLSVPKIEDDKKAKPVIVVHPDGKKIGYLWNKKKIDEQFRKLFHDKGYSLETFAAVDQQQIALDLTNDNALLSRDYLFEYSILRKSFLVKVELDYCCKLIHYFTKLECPIINVLNRCLNDQMLGTISSPNNVFCFFDDYERLIYDGTVEQLCQIDNQENKLVRIHITKEEQTISFNEILYRTAQDEEKTVLFHPRTLLLNLNHWFRQQIIAKDFGTDQFAYFIKKKSSVVNESDRISSCLESFESVAINVLSRDSTMNIKVSYGDQSQQICVLKTMKVDQLFNNEHLLSKLNSMGDSLRDCVLVLGENHNQILSQEDTRKAIGTYFIDDQHAVEFCFSLLIQISTYNNEEILQQIPLLNKNVTIEELFRLSKGLARGYRHLASCHTKKILEPHQPLSNINETRFLLVKENETCSVVIKRSTENQLVIIAVDQNDIQQDFACFATIGDVFNVNQLSVQSEYLLYGNDFLPSMETQLRILQSNSSIEFNLVEERLPIHVTIENSTDGQTVNFHCALTLTFNRLCSIACQLLSLNTKFYQLMYDELLITDDEMCLDDLDCNSAEVKFELICNAPLKAVVQFGEKKISIPCTKETSISSLIEKTFLKLNISMENSSEFELFALADERIVIDFDSSVEDVYQLFSDNSETIPFELQQNS